MSGSLDFTGFIKSRSVSLKFRNQVNAGTYINNLFNSPELNTDSKVMIEKTLDYVHILLTAKHPEQTLCDRKPIKFVKREVVPSILRKPLAELNEYLFDKNIKYVIVRSKDLKTRFKDLSFALEDKTFGDWTIYKIALSQTE